MSSDPNAPIEASTMPWDPPAFAAPRAYEFDAAENEVLAGLARNAGFVGVAGLVLATVALFGAGCLGALAARLDARADASDAAVAELAGGAVASGVLAILGFVVGARLLRAAGALRRVVTTKGDDVPHLMDALRMFRKVFGLARALVILAVVVALLGAVLVVALVSLASET